MKEKILECKSISEICETVLLLHKNGKNYKKVYELLKKYNIDRDFFNNEKKYNKNKNKCLNCNKEIEYKKRENIYCCSSCSASNTRKNKTHSEKTKEKISKTLLKINNIDIIKKCENCNTEFIIEKQKNKRISKRKYCSDICKQNSITKKLSDAVQTRIKNGTHKGWQSRKIRSYAEKFFETVLINNNIIFHTEFKINKRDLGFENSSNYFLDFYLPDYNIDLEIDGKQHEQSDRKKSDEIRDKAITKYGLKVYRIKWKNPHKNKEYITNEINNLLLFLKEIEIE